jgi:ribose transport system substrate-binding protein
MKRASFGIGLLLFSSLAWIVAGCNSANNTSSPGGATSGKTSTDKPAADKAAGDKSVKRLVLLINNPSPYWETARAGMNSAAKDLKLAGAGLEAVFEANDGTTQGQLDKLRQFGTQSDIVGIAVSAVKADNLAVVEEMRKLRAKGIHIVTMDADVDRARFRDAREFYIGTDNVQGGRALGTATKKLLEARKVEHGGYVQFVGYVGAQNAMERMDGFKEAIGPDYTEVERKEDGGNRTKARDAVRTALINHPDLVALIGIWSYNAPAICDVVSGDLAKRNQLTIATFDAEPGAIQAMGKGLIDVMVVQDPFDIGFQATRVLKALHENDKATVKEMFPKEGSENGDLHDTSLKVVVPDDKSPVTADLFKPKFGDRVQFMTLPTFQQWLKKYDLTGS